MRSPRLAPTRLVDRREDLQQDEDDADEGQAGGRASRRARRPPPARPWRWRKPPAARPAARGSTHHTTASGAVRLRQHGEKLPLVSRAETLQHGVSLAFSRSPPWPKRSERSLRRMRVDFGTVTSREGLLNPNSRLRRRNSAIRVPIPDAVPGHFRGDLRDAWPAFAARGPRAAREQPNALWLAARASRSRCGE